MNTKLIIIFPLFFSVLHCCDPILLSIITSKELSDQREQEIQAFSASLNILGGKWRREEVLTQQDLNSIKLKWLKIFESYFNKPAKGADTQNWESSFLEISNAIRALQNNANSRDYDAIHRSIIHIQNLLISLYDYSNLPFFDSINLIKELLIQHRKTKDRLLEQDLKRIHSRIVILWREAYSNLPSEFSSQYEIKTWNEKLDEILNYSSGDFENLGLSFLQRLNQAKWDSLEP